MKALDYDRNRPPVALALALTAVALAFLLLGGCSEPLAPMLPEWDVDANLPLVNKTYTMQDMLSDDDMLRITQNGDQVLLVTRKYPLNAIRIGDHLRVDDQSFRLSEKLDIIRFDIPDYLDQAMDVFTLFPTLPRGSQVVPSMRNELGMGIEIDAREWFEEMTFESGALALEFTNSTPVPLRLEAIRLVGLDNREVARNSYSGTVQPNAKVNLPVMRLDGLTLSSRMRLAFDVSTPGSGGANVNVSSSHYLGVKGSIADSRILSVKGFVPSQQTTVNDNIDLAGATGLRIKDGLVRSGSISFVVSNHFNLGADITIGLGGATRGGAPLSTSATVPAKGSKTITLDLSGAELRPVNDRLLPYQAHIVTEDASDRTVLVRRYDSVSVNGSVKSVAFDRMTGTLAPRTLRIREMEKSNFGIDRKISGSIKLNEANMWAALRNQAVLRVGIQEASVLGKMTGGSNARLSIPRRDLDGNSQTTITFDRTQVVNFLNSFTPDLPDSLGIEGTFVLNPDGQSGSAAAEDSVVGDLFVEFPLRFTQVNGSVTDTVEMVIDESTRRKLTEVNEGTITFVLENHLPTSVTIRPEFLDKRYAVLLAPVAVDGSAMAVPAAPVDGNGYVTAPRSERIEMRFSGADFLAVSRAAWIRFTLAFNASEQSGCTFRSSDYVRVRGFARLNVSSTITEK
ncbi:MAG TPA: hypothetical protein PK916_04170 [Bacteroidota bacterium]|nr:hypothetical protein [Bacteroidota bacterium]